MNKVEFIRCFYEPRLCEGVDDHEILGWENKEAQNLRFQVLTDHVHLENKSILDVGCGLGNLYGFLNEKAIDCAYTGVDILEPMVKEAQIRFPEAKFTAGDIFTSKLFQDHSFDIIFSSGIFNLNLGNNAEFFPLALTKLLTLAKESVVFNLLHKKSPNPDPEHFFYYHPDEVIDILSSIMPEKSNIRLIEEYLPNDFSVICSLK